MKQSPLILSLGATALTVSACATPVGAVRQAVSSAPEWYQEARVEIRGEGYPDVSRVVALEHNGSAPGRVDEARLAVADSEARLLSQLGPASSEAELQAALAWAAAEQAAFSGIASEGEFLDDSDLEVLRGLFTVGRAQP